jgi:hypothetical protein
MINEYEKLSSEEKEKVTHVIKTLLSQTYLLERKYDKRQKRMQVNQDFRACDGGLMEFIQDYFNIADIQVKQDLSNGVIYLDGGEREIGTRLSEYTTKFILILKVIFDEQMSTASTSSFVITSRAEVQEKMAGFNLLTRQPTGNDIKSTFRLLKKYQIIEPLDNSDESDLTVRFMIYPTINMVLLGEDIRKLVETYCVNVEKAQQNQIDEELMDSGEEETYGTESEI